MWQKYYCKGREFGSILLSTLRSLFCFTVTLQPLRIPVPSMLLDWNAHRIPFQSSETPKSELPTEEHCPTPLAVAHTSRQKAEDPLRKNSISHDGWHQPTRQLTTTTPPAKCQHRSPHYFSSDRVNLWKFLQLILVRELFVHILLMWVANWSPTQNEG